MRKPEAIEVKVSLSIMFYTSEKCNRLMFIISKIFYVVKWEIFSKFWYLLIDGKNKVAYISYTDTQCMETTAVKTKKYSIVISWIHYLKYKVNERETEERSFWTFEITKMTSMHRNTMSQKIKEKWVSVRAYRSMRTLYFYLIL